MGEESDLLRFAEPSYLPGRPCTQNYFLSRLLSPAYGPGFREATVWETLAHLLVLGNLSYKEHCDSPL